MTCRMCRGKTRLGLLIAGLLTPILQGNVVHHASSEPSMLGGVWIGGQGYWSAPGNWDTSSQTNANAPQTVVIDGGSPVASLVLMDVDASIHGLAIDAGDGLWVLGGHTLTMQDDMLAPQITCAGYIRLENLSRIMIAAGQSLVINGGGEISMSAGGESAISGEGGSLLHNTNVVLHGAGRIGENSFGILNNGIIRASEFEQELIVDPGAAGLINSGELAAINGGRLVLLDAGVLNTGRLFAGDQSRIELEGTTIVGGRFEREGNGFLRAMGTPSTLANVINNAEVELGLARMTLVGRLENNGAFNVVAGATLGMPDEGGTEGATISELVIPPGTGDFVLDGDGTLSMRQCMVHSGTAAASGRLIHGANHTLSGDGQLGANTVGLINHGTIIADHYAPLAIDPPNAQPLLNNGTMLATGFGGMSVTGATFTNNGSIEVRDASRFVITSNVTLTNNNNGTLSGGRWRVIADGHPTSIAIWGGTQIFTNSADILLSGVGSLFSPLNGFGANTGRLALRNGRDFATSSAFLVNSGVLDLGATCLLTVNGAFVQDALGRLVVEVDGSDGEGLTATGVATLGGVLEIRLSPSATNVVGQTISVLRATTISGQFSEIIAPAGVSVSLSGGAVSVTVQSICPADITGDGAVAIDDLLGFISGWGLCPPPPDLCPWDLNGNGEVEVSDLLAIISAWGACPQ
jgi:hypothetical protein